MGEIKSTLDLVMERTRHLSLSTEEKEKQLWETYRKRLQGILQQVADGTVHPEAFLEKADALQQELAVTDAMPLTKAVVDRIDPGGDNATWLALLGKMSPDTVGPLQEILQLHDAQQVRLRQTRQDAIRQRLADQSGVSGSAVEPNPQKDPAFQEQLSTLRQETVNKIKAVTEDLCG